MNWSIRAVGCVVFFGFGVLLLMGAANKPAGIPAWEYQIFSSGEFLNVDGQLGPTTNEFLAERLNKQGEEGWEFTGIVAVDSWVFRRPVIGDE